MNSTKLVEYFTCYYGLPIWMRSPPVVDRIPFIVKINKMFIAGMNKKAAEYIHEQAFHHHIVATFHAHEGMDAVEFYTNGEIPFYDESI